MRGSIGDDGVRLFERLEHNRGLNELVAPVHDESFAGDEVIFEQEDHCPRDV